MRPMFGGRGFVPYTPGSPTDPNVPIERWTSWWRSHYSFKRRSKCDKEEKEALQLQKEVEFSDTYTEYGCLWVAHCSAIQKVKERGLLIMVQMNGWLRHQQEDEPWVTVMRLSPYRLRQACKFCRLITSHMYLMICTSKLLTPCSSIRSLASFVYSCWIFSLLCNGLASNCVMCQVLSDVWWVFGLVCYT
jgi:hypothetical protein